jgi:hypothetical protein
MVKNTLKSWISTDFKNNRGLSKTLGVSAQIVGIWVTQNPRGLLKYLPELKAATGKPYSYIVNIILCADHEVNAKESVYTKEG